MNNRNELVLLPACLLAAGILAPGFAQAQMTSTGIDCSQVSALHLLMQDNMRAGLTLMECGVIPRPNRSATNAEDEASLPPNVLISNRNCGTNCTKSEDMIWHSSRADDNTVVDNFNDHNPAYSSYSGTSYSTDNGATWTELQPPPFATGHGTNYGDPIVVYNQKLGLWFGGDLVTGCGGQGIGLWTSPDGINWTAGACAHSNSADDRESMWVDNNPFSAAYGRMYISFNNFNVGSGALQLVRSDDGSNWSAAQTIYSTFLRDVQLTGALPGPPPPQARYYSEVILASMDEGGGGLNTRQNIIWRSRDGGVTWASSVTGPRFNPPGDGICSSNSYFAMMNPIWRYMGWGEPGVGPGGIVHYAYATQGAISGGDIYYIRSTDGGATWSAPVLLNDPETNPYQSHWMPSLSVNYNPFGFAPAGKVTVAWYDRRQATTPCTEATDPGCSYQIFGTQSTDGGMTWSPNFTISDQIIPQPTQGDDGVQPCYAGDYDYDTAFANSAFVTWTDGRRVVQGVHVEDVEGDVVPEP